MKAIICKQASRHTTLGKCYPAILLNQVNGHRVVKIKLDNGVYAEINKDGELCTGGFNSIAKFDATEVSKECYLKQPSMTEYEARAISVIACLEMIGANNSATAKIKKSLDEGKELASVAHMWVTVNSLIREGNRGDEWLPIALKMATEFMNSEVEA